MRDHTRLIAISIVAAFLITGVSCVACTTTDDSSADDTKYYAELTAALFFNESTGAASAAEINNKAGTTVCEYADGCLTFTKNVNITCSVAGGVFIFNGNGSQKISVNENVSADIEHESSAASDSTGAIAKTGSGDLTLSGPGELTVGSFKSGVACSNNIIFEGKSTIAGLKNGVICKNAYFNEGANVGIIGSNNGLLMSGSELSFKKCSVAISNDNSSGYGIKDPNISKISIESSNLLITGSTSAFSKRATTTSSILCNIYGSNSSTSADEMSSIELNDITNYKNVRVTSQLSIDSSAVPYIIAIVIGAIVIIAIIVLHKKKGKKDRCSSAPPTYSATPIPPEQSYEANTQVCEASREQTTDNVVPRHPSDERIEIVTQSLVDGVSFALIVDGSIVGYIGPHPSFIDAPAGMHNIVVLTNDSQRKTVHKMNQIIRHGMKITVVKKLGGYKVEIQ